MRALRSRRLSPSQAALLSATVLLFTCLRSDRFWGCSAANAIFCYRSSDVHPQSTPPTHPPRPGVYSPPRQAIGRGVEGECKAVNQTLAPYPDPPKTHDAANPGVSSVLAQLLISRSCPYSTVPLHAFPKSF